MKRLSHSLLALTVALTFGCGVRSPLRSSPDKILTAAGINAELHKTDTTPKLDILIVVDNSKSMAPNQDNLARNIDQFVQAFSSKATLDFHIGVETIWDSDPVHSKMIQAKHPLGQLIPLQDPTQPRGTPLLVNGQMPPRFVTRETPDLSKVLASTIKLGDDYGPELEEMFSPVLAFFDPANLNGPNAGFYRPDAHLLVVFITDANDQSLSITPKNLFDSLLSLKGGNTDLLHFYSIIWKGKVPGVTCGDIDNAGYPDKFIALETYGGKDLNLCSANFGSELGEFARTLSVKVSHQVIHLGASPDRSRPFVVRFGSQIIPKNKGGDREKGWSFISDPVDPRVDLGGNLDLKPEPGASIHIDFTPVNLDGVASGDANVMTPKPGPRP